MAQGAVSQVALDRSDAASLSGVTQNGNVLHGTQGSHGINYHHPDAGVNGYQFFMPGLSYLGHNALAGAATHIQSLGHKHALVVTDKVLVQVGAVKPVIDMLDSIGVRHTTFDGVAPNPTVEQVEQGADILKHSDCDFIVSFGGGSPHDCAKAIGIVATNGGRIQDYEGVNKMHAPMLPLVAINTTAGTASELTRFTIITDTPRHVKMAIIDGRVTPTLAVDDPALMVGMPKGLTAATGMDALTHAIEAYVSTISTPITDACALHAIRLISAYLRTAVADGADLKARDMMSYAQYLAGMAFNSASLGYVHAMAHQLGGLYNLPHGVCNAVLLPAVQQYNARFVPELFEDIAEAMGVPATGPEQAAQNTLAAIRKLSADVAIPRNLKELGVKPEDFEVLADNAMKDACGFTNPHQPTKEEVIALYRQAYEQ